MKKIIKRQAGVCVDVRDKVYKVKEEFYSHDKNNAFIELQLNGVNAEKIIVLFHFKTTNRFLEVVGNVTGNVAVVPFDTSLITTDEIVYGFVYAEKIEQSADILKFSFGVRLSEIDKHSELPVIEKDTKRIVALTEIVTKTELQEAIRKIRVAGGQYDDSEILRRLQALETKSEIDTSAFATKQELENKVERAEISHISTEIEALKTKTNKDTVYDDSGLKQRILALENKHNIDTSNLVTRQELEGKGYLTQHQSLEGYAKKSEISQAYNDTEVKQRLSTIEQKGESYATKEQLASIPKTPQKLTLSGNTLILSDGGGSVNLPTNATPTPSRTGQSNEYEIHGTGMPNGKVTAPVGTTYIDTNVTNGALKWIKRKGDNNQGWEVMYGDTGWKRLSISSGYQQSTLRVRRINNVVTYKLDGLNKDLFGIVRRGGPGYLSHASDIERNVYLLYNNRIPVGYRSAMSLSGQIFDGTGNPYGSWFFGGINNGNYFMFHFTNPVPTDNNITDIVVSNISYITDDPWPTV
ncbi:hypothetical protein [Streptococcus sp. 263_SSPC]|uniref:hypothetical protein n=1 Tax=Streptococcus sp. 263_SSPC TaxID=1579343 RepID=UPI000660EDC3|nr:hypothetical protein [Streptococcus sp. 263_SSPC]